MPIRLISIILKKIYWILVVKMEWVKLKFITDGAKGNRNVLLNIIKPLVEEFEPKGFIVNFFFLQYWNNKPINWDDQRVTFVFYGDKNAVLEWLKKNQIILEDKCIEGYNGEVERFKNNDFLGRKIFEVGSRFALLKFANDEFLEYHKKSDGSEYSQEGLFVMLHAFLQNLNYGDIFETRIINPLSSCIKGLHTLFTDINIPDL